MSNYTNNGVQVKVPRHASLAAFTKSAAPLSVGTQWKGSNFHEFEYVSSGERHIQVSGREFLGQIAVGESIVAAGVDLPLGSRLAIFPINPEALGGRLELYTHMYRQHKAISLRVLYEPIVPATTEGAIFMYFRNDVGTTTLPTGRQELMHAATLPEFVSTPVWECAELHISPSNTNIRYANEASGARFSTQGFVQVETASILAEKVYGNVYIEYTMHFFAPSLDYEISDVESIFCVFSAGNTCVVTDGEAINIAVDAITTTTPYISFRLGSPTGPVYVPSTEEMIYVTISGVSTTLNTLNNIPWNTTSDETLRTFGAGQGLWFRFNFDPDVPALKLMATVYESLEAATGAIFRAEDGNVVNDEDFLSAGQLRWRATGTSFDGDAVDGYGRTWRLGGT
jgi:hypothetical protein